MILTYTILIILWLSLIVYAVLGGADFGGGIWDFFAFGQGAERERRLIGQALGPVWEANHVWLIFLIVGLFTAFPSAFSVLSTALIVPFTLALIGIVLRGAAFIFRAQSDEAGTLGKSVWIRVWAGVLSPPAPSRLSCSVPRQQRWPAARFASREVVFRLISWQAGPLPSHSQSGH